jgi:D-3-phosphoglycerate dehydrogenase
MRKVLIPTKLDKVVEKILSEHGFTVVQNPDVQLADLAAENSDASAIIVRSEKVTPEIMDGLKDLKLVVRAGAGFDNIDIRHARKLGIDVMNTPGANSNAVAEEVIALILAAYRKLVPADQSTRAGKWEKKSFMGRELTGKTVGILGLGNIGRLLIKRLSGFDVKILAYDPVLSAELADRLGATLCSVEEVFAQSDIVSLHIPENDKTRGMVNAKLLGLMKKGAMLVNCARAGIVDEDAIRAAKQEKDLIFCNDVYAKDAAGDKSVADIADIMLPHLGASTKEANFLAAKRAADQTVAYFEDGVTACVVNKGVPDGLDANYQKLASVLAGLGAAALNGRAISQIELSCYGKLHQFSKWMIAPVTAAICPQFDAFSGADEALKILESRGIKFTVREVDESKHYGEAITLDFIAGSDRISIRGTIAEGRLMVSRINSFDGIYIHPAGNYLFVEYEDAPGIIGKITGLFGQNNINITDVRAPHSLENTHSMLAVNAESPIPADLVKEIAKAVNAFNAFAFDC